MTGQGCVYGHQGSQLAACDRDAVTLRDTFPYCQEHADHIDWCRENQSEVDQ